MFPHGSKVRSRRLPTEFGGDTGGERSALLAIGSSARSRPRLATHIRRPPRISHRLWRTLKRWVARPDADATSSR